ncbi:MAG: hypothetical protein IBJ10_04680 [Phycisphaerales bacterium]|nr:hypothetical protein [Phycisphaerales bacterium]
MRAIPVIVLGVASSAALSAPPAYEAPALQARANFSGAFNLPNAAFFTNSTPAINDDARVAFRVAVIAGTEADGMWFGGGGAGSIIYFSPDNEDSALSDPTLNNAGFIATEQRFTSPSGVLRIDTSDNSGSVVVTPGFPFGVTSFGSPLINASGQIGYRGGVTGAGQAFISWSNGVQAIHAAEAGYNPASDVSFLFTPAFNDQRRIAGKVRLGAAGQTGETQPDQVRVYAADGSFVVIARDVDSQPGSPYARFDNSVALTNDGRVAFIATLAAGGRGVFLSDGTTTVQIAREGVDGVGSIEFFSPSANDAGLVAFRAFDAGGLRAVWVGDGTGLVAVAREHDLVETDLGTGQINENTASSPGFGGAPRINARGDVVFMAALTPPGNDAVEWGSGCFVALAKSVGIPGDIDGDGDVDFADLNLLLSSYNQTGPNLPADLDGDGDVDFADLNILLGNYNAGS